MLTENQKDIIRWLVLQTKNGHLAEEFIVAWCQLDHTKESPFHGYSGPATPPPVTSGALEALADEGLLIRTVDTNYGDYSCTLTGRAFHAVNNDFESPDVSFIQHLTPLADITKLDTQIKLRCLPPLGAGAEDPKMWDTAVRNALVILEDRIREVGGIEDGDLVGKALVNKVFGKTGPLAKKFTIESEREGHRDLYAGVFGAIRNPYGHRFIDPTPENGGAIIVFVDMLLRQLEDLR